MRQRRRAFGSRRDARARRQAAAWRGGVTAAAGNGVARWREAPIGNGEQARRGRRRPRIGARASARQAHLRQLWLCVPGRRRRGTGLGMGWENIL